MNTKLLGLLAAASLATAACQQDKTVETTTTTTPETTTTTTVTTDTMAIHDDARRMAAQVAEDLKLTDPVVVQRIERTYYTRGRALNPYLTDTTGRYAATRAANDAANDEIRTILPESSLYNTYASNLGTYYAGQPYTTVVVAAPAAGRPSLNARVGQGSGIKKLENEKDGDHKVKFENGAKIKRDDDGSVKIKRADGTRIKIDEDGNRTVKKGLFK